MRFKGLNVVNDWSLSKLNMHLSFERPTGYMASDDTRNCIKAVWGTVLESPMTGTLKKVGVQARVPPSEPRWEKSSPLRQ